MSTLPIPAHLTDVVEHVAKAQFDRLQAVRMDAGRFRDDGQPWTWDDLGDHDRHTYRALVLPTVLATVEALGVTE
jgi:hypothetical protein